MEVLAVSGLHRANRGWDSPQESVLARVRVRDTHAEGYAFVRASEFSAACPMLVTSTIQPLAERLAQARRRRFAERGVFALPNRPLRGGFDPMRDAVVTRLDADADGRRDAVLLLRSQGRNGAFVLRRDTAAGWTAADLVERLDHDHFGADYLGALTAPGTVYFQTDWWSMGAAERTGCAGAGAVDDSAHWTDLRRLHPDGDVLVVAWQPTEPTGEPTRWTVSPDGSVRVEGTATHRAQSMRWDTTDFALVPDGPTLPLIEGDVSRCRPG